MFFATIEKAEKEEKKKLTPLILFSQVFNGSLQVFF